MRSAIPKAFLQRYMADKERVAAFSEAAPSGFSPGAFSVSFDPTPCEVPDMTEASDVQTLRDVCPSMGSPVFSEPRSQPVPAGKRAAVQADLRSLLAHLASFGKGECVDPKHIHQYLGVALLQRFADRRSALYQDVQTIDVPQWIAEAVEQLGPVGSHIDVDGSLVPIACGLIITPGSASQDDLFRYLDLQWYTTCLGNLSMSGSQHLERAVRSVEGFFPPSRFPSPPGGWRGLPLMPSQCSEIMSQCTSGSSGDPKWLKAIRIGCRVGGVHVFSDFKLLKAVVGGLRARKLPQPKEVTTHMDLKDGSWVQLASASSGEKWTMLELANLEPMNSLAVAALFPPVSLVRGYVPAGPPVRLRATPPGWSGPPTHPWDPGIPGFL